MDNITKNTPNIFNQISLQIIREQAFIIGPVAWVEAGKVSGLNITDSKQGIVSFSGDPKTTINQLVAQYERLFGRASHEVCKEAAKDLVKNLPADQVPSSLV